MTTPRRLAVSYSRFSHARQAQGDSEGRQEKDFRAFCRFHDLTPTPEVYIDRGKSGYDDSHRRRGRLGQLIAAAKDGRFEPGTVIVVEAWDRLGRLRPDRQTALVAELVQTGVSVGVCRLNDVFTEEDFGTHKWTTLSVFVQLAYQESKQKAERLASVWAKRRERAREAGTPMAQLLPYWLERAGGAVRVVPERGAAIRRIFELAIAGYGNVPIVRRLIAEGVAPFGKSGKWTKPYVQMILTDRRVLGEVAMPDGPPLKLHPAVVTEEEFLLAKSALAGRLLRPAPPGIPPSQAEGGGGMPGGVTPGPAMGLPSRAGGGAARQSKHVNVFKGLLRHARDGEGFFLGNSGQKRTRTGPQLTLRTVAGDGGRGQKIYTFPYLIFEEAVLSLLKEVDPADVLPARRESPGAADALRAKLASVRGQLVFYKDQLREAPSRGLAELLREKEAEEEQVAARLQEELARGARAAERAWAELPSLADLVKGHDDDARVRMRPVLRGVVDEIWLLLVRRGCRTLAAVQVFFRGGAARRDYLIVNQSAGNNRAGGWRGASLADVIGPRDFDLRRPAHARQLEGVLAARDPGLPLT
jgi:DNA invertase Pin-like site-specific DNA recombinase